MGEQYLPKRLRYLPVDTEFARLHQDAYEPQSEWAMKMNPLMDNELRVFRTIDHLGFIMSGPVPDRVIPNLEQVEGRWHPSGFMVFPLGEHRDLGFVRLHIWPKELRRREDRGRDNLGDVWDGDIHNHAWHVTSYVIAGYCDTLYDVARDPDPNSRSYESVTADALHHFRMFRAKYNKASGADALVTQGRSVIATPREEREFFPTDINEIKVGDYHAPTIPDDEFAATLAFNSHRVTRSGPDILIGGTATSIVGVRRRVTTAEKLFAKAQLLQAMERLEEVEKVGGDLNQLPGAPKRISNLALVSELPNANAS